MQKDLKIGMILGLVLVTVTMLWFFAGSNLNLKARILNLRSNREAAPPPETFGPAQSSEVETAREERGIGVHPIILIIGVLGWAIFMALMFAEILK